MVGRNSAGIKSFAKAALKGAAAGATTLALSAGSAWAQEGLQFAQSLSGVTVEGERAAPESPKYTAPLLETPQTVTVVSSEVIEQQNLLNLRDVLSTLPGITFGAGEGGGGYGDSINLRGYSANTDITVDGVRDSAQYSRTDPFNLEQVEVINGANSVYAGAGSVGGSINLATKRPMGSDRSIVTLGAGTDAYGRLTVDSDVAIGGNIGVRLNAMAHQNDVPGRDVETYERWGIAPAITFGLNTDTRFTLALVHQEDDNTPQYGVPYALGPFNDGALPGADPSDYFGYRNIDTQQVEVSSITGTIEHDFNENLSIRNLTRYQRVNQLIVVNPPQGAWCIDSGINPWTGAACATPGVYLPSGPRGGSRDTENEILINQTDLRSEFTTGSLAHTLVVGVSFSNETYNLESGNVLRNADGSTIVLPPMDISNPDSVYTGPTNFIRTGLTESEVNNQAIYLFDRIEINDQWEINGGVRFEHNEGEANVTSFSYAPPAPPVTTIAPPAIQEDDLFSYRVGVVYQPVSNASLYAAYGNSRAPSQTSVNGGCNNTSTTGTQNCNLDPEEAVTYEVGAKWDVMDGRLSLTAALFRNERTNFRVASGDPTVPQQQLDGSSRVDGIALGAAGLLADNWSIFANYTYLDSEILQNISDIAVGGGAIDFQSGDPLPNTPEHSFSLWTTYELPIGVMVGYGVTYQGEYTFNRASATADLYYTPSYWVHRAMASYEVTDNVSLQLNVNNLFDEEYYERVRNNATNGWATPGAGRSAVLSLAYRF